MKRKTIFLFAVLGVTLSALAFTGMNSAAREEACPLKGTPACPEYPACCK